MGEKYYKNLFLIGALYDFLLGFGFLFFYKLIYAFFNMTLPNNPAYLSLCAMLIGLYGVLLFMISKDPKNSKDKIIYATLIKFGFVIIIVYYWLARGAAFVDMPFRILAGVDLIFGILFVQSLKFASK